MSNKVKTAREPLFHLNKRTDISTGKAWFIRVAMFIFAFLFSSILTILLSGQTVAFFFKYFFEGAFGAKGVTDVIWDLFYETALLLMIALAVTPAFKMRFWNIGGEGQILMGALGTAVIMNAMGATAVDGVKSDGLTIFLSLLLAMAFGMAWAVIPALFKAKWNTNETLLTLMMNYIAIRLVQYFTKAADPRGTGSLFFNDGLIAGIADNQSILPIIISIVLTIIMAIYFNYSKHGYEITVVGESENTARYVGINTKKVVIRTLLLCGVLSGIIGFLLVSAKNYSINMDAVGGRGFTGVLISWLGHFNPFAMGLCSFLYAFALRGSSNVGNMARMGDSYANIIVGILFLFILATEFFINYKVTFKHGGKVKAFFQKIIGKMIKKENVVVASNEEATLTISANDEAQEEDK